MRVVSSWAVSALMGSENTSGAVRVDDGEVRVAFRGDQVGAHQGAVVGDSGCHHRHLEGRDPDVELPDSREGHLGVSEAVSG
jgi:hypothetical protein